jgi:hypothetical protein
LKKYKVRPTSCPLTEQVNNQKTFPKSKATTEDKPKRDIAISNDSGTRVLRDGNERLVICLCLDHLEKTTKKDLDTVFEVYAFMLSFRGSGRRIHLLYQKDNKIYLYMVFLAKVHSYEEEIKTYMKNIGWIVVPSLKIMGFNIKRPEEPVVINYPVPDSWVDCREQWRCRTIPKELEKKDTLCLVWASNQLEEEEIYSDFLPIPKPAIVFESGISI